MTLSRTRSRWLATWLACLGLWALPARGLAGFEFAVKKKSSTPVRAKKPPDRKSHLSHPVSPHDLQRHYGNQAVQRILRAGQRSFINIAPTHMHIVLQQLSTARPMQQFQFWHTLEHESRARPEWAKQELWRHETERLEAAIAHTLKGTPAALSALGHPVSEAVPRTLGPAEQWAARVLGLSGTRHTNREVLDAYKAIVHKLPDNVIAKVTYAAYLLLKEHTPVRGRKAKRDDTKQDPPEDPTGQEPTPPEGPTEQQPPKQPSKPSVEERPGKGNQRPVQGATEEQPAGDPAKQRAIRDVTGE